ncbi:hypothetical protein WP2_06 [Lactococcus phage WP-2]|uniref:Uncharacterized protein n=1 Tax=Lactococcus phage WP-2 TaxID=1486423 RepID=A0A024B471_9CAUD|nr:hypothetical protein WP2_06 [Lactococcus phage WP-2]AHZ10878.1 hypothetical protein WP2_06 [Lactococcus phage WP-2]
MKVKNTEISANVTTLMVSELSTQNYNDKDGKFATEVKRKTTSIVPMTAKDKKKLLDLGLTEYTTKPNADGEVFSFFKVKFSKQTEIYDMQQMVKSVNIMDDTFPNFTITDIEIAINTFDNGYGKMSNRLVAFKHFADSEMEIKRSNPFGFDTETLGKFQLTNESVAVEAEHLEEDTTK